MLLCRAGPGWVPIDGWFGRSVGSAVRRPTPAGRGAPEQPGEVAQRCVEQPGRRRQRRRERAGELGQQDLAARQGGEALDAVGVDRPVAEHAAA